MKEFIKTSTVCTPAWSPTPPIRRCHRRSLHPSVLLRGKRGATVVQKIPETFDASVDIATRPFFHRRIEIRVSTTGVCVCVCVWVPKGRIKRRGRGRKKKKKNDKTHPSVSSFCSETRYTISSFFSFSPTCFAPFHALFPTLP